jgi:hypothetical protein
VDEKVQKELDAIEAVALRVVRREAANERDRAAIRDKLPELRAAGVKASVLERRIHSVYVAGTISKWTKHVAPPSRRKNASRPES